MGSLSLSTHMAKVKSKQVSDDVRAQKGDDPTNLRVWGLGRLGLRLRVQAGSYQAQGVYTAFLGH